MEGEIRDGRMSVDEVTENEGNGSTESEGRRCMENEG